MQLLAWLGTLGQQDQACLRMHIALQSARDKCDLELRLYAYLQLQAAAIPTMKLQPNKVLICKPAKHLPWPLEQACYAGILLRCTYTLTQYVLYCQKWQRSAACNIADNVMSFLLSLPFLLTGQPHE